MTSFFSKEYRISVIYLLRWTMISIVAAGIASLTIYSFIFCFNLLQSFLTNTELPLLIWPVCGAILVGFLYRLQPDAAGEGIPSYIHGIRQYRGALNLKSTLVKYPAAFFTLAAFGTGGLIGPLGRVNAGIMSLLTKKILRFKYDDYDLRTGTICGFAATVGLLIQAPIGGGIFAVEIIQRASMRYRDLFPAILSSSIASLVGRALGWQSFYNIRAPFGNVAAVTLIPVLCISIAAGLVGKLYIVMYQKTALLFKRDARHNLHFKVILGSILAAGVAWVIHPHLLGSSRELIQAVFVGDAEFITGNLNFLPFSIIMVLLIFGKSFANCVTVGSGMSAGLTAPAAIIGMLIGALTAHLMGYVPGSIQFYALIAAGFSSTLASIMNVPIAAAVIGVELFGLNYAFIGAFSAITGFQVNRHDTIYDYHFFRSLELRTNTKKNN